MKKYITNMIAVLYRETDAYVGISDVRPVVVHVQTIIGIEVTNVGDIRLALSRISFRKLSFTTT